MIRWEYLDTIDLVDVQNHSRVLSQLTSIETLHGWYSLISCFLNSYLALLLHRGEIRPLKNEIKVNSWFNGPVHLSSVDSSSLLQFVIGNIDHSNKNCLFLPVPDDGAVSSHMGILLNVKWGTTLWTWIVINPSDFKKPKINNPSIYHRQSQTLQE